ncbi:MAG TPA: hypothetical protein VFW65_21870 [Pseudonocardiaceae bacterium]|nr:hypothetical protein [Pseudonocardiaceae bacterium]
MIAPYSITYLAWQYQGTGLELRIVDRRVRMPEPLATLLLGDGGHGLTDDPATDLLRLEHDLRAYARHLASQIADATEEIAYARDEITLASVEHGLAGRHHRKTALDQLATAVTAHSTLVDRHQMARTWINLVRGFVINAAIPDGLLAEATAGWQRSPAVPAFVVVFDTERAFLDVDPRHAAPAWWGTPIPAGIDFGDLWRRDGDDDAAPLPRCGPWRLSYLPITGEIYAARRGSHLPEQVWLLGSGFHNRDRTVALLLELEAHMREPNSLILAACSIHTEWRHRTTEARSFGTIRAE